VSVHDVSPSALDEVRWLLARLDEAGVRRRVLKVIPAPGGAELAAGSELVELLRGEDAAGSEIVQHGYTHRTAGPIGGSALDALRARAFARDDAEFLSLEPAAARERLRAGRAVLEGLGLEVRGFCAPGWLSPGWLNGILAEEGFAYAIGLLQVTDLDTGRHRTVPAFGYMGADALQERLVGLGGDTSLALHRWISDRVPHLRVFLHPRGARTSDRCARALHWIRRLAAEGQVATYADLMAST
jgi:predicted deacetylase